MRIALTLSLAATLLALTTSAQEGTAPTSRTEHKWLKQFAGEWTSVSTTTGQHMTGTMTARMVGQYWVANTYEATVGGMPFEALQTIGYDPRKGKYIGTWVDSMMNHMWMYEGSVDASGKKIVLEAEGPDYTTGKMAKYRDCYEFKTPDLFIATSEMQGGDGKWTTIMTAEVKRNTP